MLAGDGVRVALERQASSWLGHPVRIAVARPRLFPQPGLHLERVEVGDPVTLTLGTVDVSSDGRALLSRRIERASIQVANSRIAMPLPFSLPTASTPETAPANPAIRLVSIESIGLRDIVVTSRGRELTISGDSSLAGSRLLLRAFSARTGATTLSAEGEVDLAPRVDARLKVKANRLDLDELLALAAAFAPPPTGVRRRHRRESPHASRLASVPRPRARAGSTVRQFATDLEVVGTRVSLSPLTFQLFGGRYQGSLAASLRDTMTATLRSRVIDLDVAQLAEFGGSPGSITGRLTGAGTFTGSGRDFAAALDSARGEGSASIAERQHQPSESGAHRHPVLRTSGSGCRRIQRSLRTTRCGVFSCQSSHLGAGALAALAGRGHGWEWNAESRVEGADRTGRYVAVRSTHGAGRQRPRAIYTRGESNRAAGKHRGNAEPPADHHRRGRGGAARAAQRNPATSGRLAGSVQAHAQPIRALNRAIDERTCPAVVIAGRTDRWEDS